MEHLIQMGEIIITLVLLECIANIIIFPIFNSLFKKEKAEIPSIETGTTTEVSVNSEINPLIKGSIERICIFISLCNGIATILVAFGAIKIATRLTPDKNKVSNDYFLLGNLISISIAVLQFYFYENHWIKEFYCFLINYMN